MWLPPGGHCDGNADIIDTVLRETQEETGIDNVNVVSNEILDIDIHLIPANPKEPEHYHYDIRFCYRLTGMYRWLSMSKRRQTYSG